VCLPGRRESAVAPHNRERKKKEKETEETHRQMDVYSNTSAWLQHSPTQVAQSSPAVQNDIADPQRPPSSTDWKDRPPSASDSNGAPSAVSGNIDLHDFGLGDLSGKHRVHALMTRLYGPDWVYPQRHRRPRRPLGPIPPSSTTPTISFSPPYLLPTMRWAMAPHPGRLSLARCPYQPILP
jgi:hypothetical protein